MPWLRRLAIAFAVVMAILVTLWAAAALYFDAQFPAAWHGPVAIAYVIAVLAALVLLRHNHRGLVIALIGFTLVALWWLGIQPPANRAWKSDDVQTSFASVDGDQVTIRNFRDCDYRTEDDFTCRWETHTYNLGSLRGADIFIDWWGSPWIAHPIISFDFGDERHVAISIGTRNAVGQSYSAIRGLFRQYALAYTVADERDLIRLRTNYRKDEELYLFRTTADPQLARQIFLGYLERVNGLHERPEWYNAITNNCTTNIAISAAEARNARTALDWRILLNGKMDEMMYERRGLVTGGLSMPALKKQAHINPAAKAADASPDFSELIRHGRVGFTEDSLPSAK